MKQYSILLTLLLGLTLAAGDKKIVVGGFEIARATSNHLSRNIEKFKPFPFDGFLITIDAVSRPDRPRSNNVMTTKATWQKEWFAKELAEVKQISAAKFNHSFLNLMLSPAERLRWDDDAAWQRFCHNAGIIAYLAKQGGVAGVMVDVEDYTAQRQFFAMPDEGEYDKVAELARKRGREFMQALTREYPDITVFALMFFCETNMMQKNTDPFALAREHRDLWIHFGNGMLEAAPKEAQIVEGNEHSFWMNAADDDYAVSRSDMLSRYRKIAYPENRSKYADLVSCSYSFYPNVYTNAARKEPVDQVMQRFSVNLGSALEHADEYVWFQCESFRWLDNWDQEGLKSVNLHTRIQKETWEQKLPGLTRLMELAKNPLPTGAQQLQEGKFTNLISNPDCRPLPASGQSKDAKANDWHQGKLPAGWTFWPEKDLAKTTLDQTVGQDDNTSLRTEGCANGAYITTVPVTPGKFYAVEGFARGDGKLVLNIRWQKSKGWLREWAGTSDRIELFGKPDARGWRRAFTVVQAPANAARMVLTPAMRQEPGEICFFDKFTVFEVK